MLYAYVELTAGLHEISPSVYFAPAGAVAVFVTACLATGATIAALTSFATYDVRASVLTGTFS